MFWSARRLLTAALLILTLCTTFSTPTPARAATFPDVSPALSCAVAVQELTSFGIIRGYADGTFGPQNALLRAQAAVTLVRAAGWSAITPSRDFSDRGTTDDELWRAVRVLADRGVARGFPDGTFAPAAGLTRQEAISFITRAMIALGAWAPQPAAVPYRDVASAHATDVATFRHYVGGVPQAAAPVLEAERAADRCWYAETLWAAVSQLPQYQSGGAGDPLTTPGPLLWGAYIDGGPWRPERLDAFAARVGKAPSLIHWGQPWWRDGQYQPFQTAVFEQMRARGAIPFLDWGSWDYTAGPQQPRFALAAIARGDHDPYIRAWAAEAAAWGQPLFLRFNWEMNGWWQFPWSTQLNGNTAADYVAAWRHVYNLFAEAGASNVTWVWCPNIIGDRTTPLSAVYPGDAYVDWVAFDSYNFGPSAGAAWLPFADLIGPTYTALRQLAPTKPIMIAEIASSEVGGDKAAWIADALGAQLPTRFPAIKAVAWFNWDDNNPAYSWPIESSPGASAAFRAAVGGNPAYLSNGFATTTTSPIRPARR